VGSIPTGSHFPEGAPSSLCKFGFHEGSGADLVGSPWIRTEGRSVLHPSPLGGTWDTRGSSCGAGGDAGRRGAAAPSSPRRAPAGLLLAPLRLPAIRHGLHVLGVHVGRVHLRAQPAPGTRAATPAPPPVHPRTGPLNGAPSLPPPRWGHLQWPGRRGRRLKSLEERGKGKEAAEKDREWRAGTSVYPTPVPRHRQSQTTLPERQSVSQGIGTKWGETWPHLVGDK
jgi:hypothetical protein